MAVRSLLSSQWSLSPEPCLLRTSGPSTGYIRLPCRHHGARFRSIQTARHERYDSRVSKCALTAGDVRRTGCKNARDAGCRLPLRVDSARSHDFPCGVFFGGLVIFLRRPVNSDSSGPSCQPIRFGLNTHEMTVGPNVIRGMSDTMRSATNCGSLRRNTRRIRPPRSNFVGCVAFSKEISWRPSLRATRNAREPNSQLWRSR